MNNNACHLGCPDQLLFHILFQSTVALNASPVNSTHVTNLLKKKSKARNILNATGNNN